MSGIKAPGLGPPIPVEGWELVHTYPSFLTSCWDSLKIFYLVSSGVPGGMEPQVPTAVAGRLMQPVLVSPFPASHPFLHQSGGRNPTHDVNRKE